MPLSVHALNGVRQHQHMPTRGQVICTAKTCHVLLSFCCIWHSIHVWYIYLHEWLIFVGNVGTYTSPMDPVGMAYFWLEKRFVCPWKSKRLLLWYGFIASTSRNTLLVIVQLDVLGCWIHATSNDFLVRVINSFLGGGFNTNPFETYARQIESNCLRIQVKIKHLLNHPVQSVTRLLKKTP